MNKTLDVKRFLEPIFTRTISYLQEDLQIKVYVNSSTFTIIDKFGFKGTASCIKVIGDFEVELLFCYEKTLIDKLEESFLGEVSNDINIKDSICNEVINIVLGNALINPKSDNTLDISIPKIYKDEQEVQNISENNAIFENSIKTDYGNLKIVCISKI